EIPRQQDGAKNCRTGIQIRPQADKLNNANAHDELVWISEPYRSFYCNRQVQHLDHRVVRVRTSGAKVCFGDITTSSVKGYCDFVYHATSLRRIRECHATM